MIEAVSDAVFVHDAETRVILDVNGKGLTLFGMTRLWNDGVSRLRKENVRDLPGDLMPWWMGRVFRNEVVAAPSVDALPAEASIGKGIISSQGVMAVMDVPLVFQGHLVGVLGLKSAHDSRASTEAEVDRRCPYVSGYAENVIVHQPVKDADARLLPKPFTKATLAYASREALDA